MSEKTGTFVVTHVDDESAVLTDAADAHVHTLSDHPDFAGGEVIEATVRAEPPMEVTWEVVAVHDRRTIPIERSPERPTKLARDIAGDQQVGEVTRREREGAGEIHVLTVPEDQTEQAIQDVIDDEETLRRAARLGVDRVEIRADASVLSVRYLP